MRAAVLYDAHDLRVEDRPEPSMADDDVIVEVIYNGLCGTDASEFGKSPLMVPAHKVHPGSGHVGPTVLGHEFIGTVVAAGRDTTLAVGTRVACGAGVSCGQCAWCRAGRTNLCERYYTLGLSTHGGMAERVAAPARICLAIDDGCRDEDAALAQPLAVGMHSVRRSGVQPGDTVVLLGAGAIGSFVAAALTGHDGPVIALDIDQGRLDVVHAVGATETHLIAPDASGEQLRELLPAGAQVVFETSGVLGATERAFALAARGGTVTLVGLNKTPQPLNLADIVLREVNIRTTVAHVCDQDLPEALALLAERPLSSLLLDRIVPLDDVVAEGLEPLLQGKATGKILVDPRVG
ncbi:2,3-butanediol dehydrogenase [Acidothermaceae bacterium B102]|nr:2,3-butanediol dehydrogenase [Acidothermaceae bacterium B102]